MGRMFKKVMALGLVLTMILLSSCGGGDSQTNGTTSPAGQTGGETTQSEKIVRITASFPLQSDPAVASNAVEAAVMFNVYDTLVFPDVDGTIVPHLAEEWSVSDDGLTYTFQIRKGVKFHDGSEMTAEDVAFSMNRLITIGEGFSYLFIPYVKEAVATDEYTVEFHMKQTFGPFLSSLVRMSVLNKEIVMNNLGEGPYGEFGDYGKAYLLTADAGCGPYTITSVSVSESMTAEKFEDYYLGWGENNPEKIQFVAVNDSATIRTLMSNRELEITDEWQSMENLNTLSAIDGIDVTNMYTGAVVNLEMNTAIAPTDDIHFRKALAYLMDYATVTSSIYPDAKQAKGPVSASYQGSDDTLFQYSYDLEKALEELKQSPYYDQLADYPITIEWSADVPDEEKICLLLQQSCAEAGITLNIQKSPFATLIANAATPETTSHITIMYPSDSYAEAGSVLSLRYHSTTSGTFTQFEWLLNDEIDAAIEDSLQTLDQSSRLKKYQQIQQDLVALCPTIWVCEWAEMRAYQSGYLYWPEAEQAKTGGINAPIMGRSMYCRTMEFIN